jgi:putative SOS response-associated peptidase YedK
MCGRYTQRTDPKRLAKEFKVAEVPEVEPRYNIAPTQAILGVVEAADGRESTCIQKRLQNS